jgi:lipoyl(octanoyl) transferase
MSPFRFEPLHCASGEQHMRHEETQLLAMEAALRAGEDTDATLPLLRLYTWDVPTLTLGKSQTPEVALGPRWEEWNRAPGLDPNGPGALVKRPTGGRAVWHEQELTYSVLFPLNHPLFQGGQRGPEEAFGTWLLEGAQRAGIGELALERGKLGRDPLGVGAAPCFASTSRHELTWHGKKWVGSARRLTSHALLQHGAIRLGPAGDRLEEWLTGKAVTDDRPWQDLPSEEVLAAHLEAVFREMMSKIS